VTGTGQCLGNAPVSQDSNIISSDTLNGYYGAIIALCILILVVCLAVLFVGYKHYTLEQEKYLLKYFSGGSGGTTARAKENAEPKESANLVNKSSQGKSRREEEDKKSSSLRLSGSD